MIGLLGAATGLTYVGTGDLNSGWTVWGGLRAYNNAAIGSNAVDIRRASDGTTQTFATIAGGWVDTAAIGVFLSGTTGKIPKLWDQTGNGWHMTQANAANMPDYVASVPSLGGRPGIKFKKVNSTLLSSANNSLSTSIGTMSAVAGKMIDDGGFFSNILNSGTAGSGLCFVGTDVAQGFAGTTSGSPCLDLSSHAFDCVFNGASSFSCIDGSIRTYNAGAASLNGSNFRVGVNLTGIVGEVGYHPSIFSQADCLAQSANKNAAWFNSTLHEGLVAFRTRRLDTADATKQFVQSVTGHVAAEDLLAICVAFENQNGGTATLTQAIEYPAGVFTQVTWLDGAPSYTYSNTYVMISDYIPVNIPAGATFWIRSYYASGDSVCFYNTWQNSFYGEATTVSATALTDLTMGGTITNSGAFSMPPCGIIGMTSKPSWFVSGDSIVQGIGGTSMEDSTNTATGRDGRVGIIGNSIGNQPFLNCGVSGSTLMPPGCTRMVGKVTHVVNEIGVNNLSGGVTAAAYIALIAAFLSLTKPKQRRYQTTITSHTTDPGTPAGAFTTLGQQTSDASKTQRNLFNDSLRAGTTGLPLTGVIDVNAPLESSQDSDVWLVSPTPPYTADGLHPNIAGYTLVKSLNLLPAPTWP